MKNFTLLFLLLVFYFSPFAQSNSYQVISPDHKLVITIGLTETNKGLSYQVAYENQPIVLESKFGITCNGEGWDKKLAVKTTTERREDTVWKPVYGERSSIRDHFNETTFTLFKEGQPNRELKIVVRAYNEGIAFRYTFPEAERGGPYLHITGETTEYTFQEQTKAWFTARAQTLHQLLPLKNWPDESDRPLTLELPNGLFACLAEAEMVDYARTKFKLATDKPNTIVGSMYDDVDDIAPFSSPWRVILVAKKAVDLLQNNDLILNLNPPCALQNTAWIKPGKVMRETSLSTVGAKKLVDFAVAQNIQYIHFDAGWYGYEYFKSSDATAVNVDPSRNPKNELDMKEVLQYAKSKGIGVWVYVNQRALALQLDTILPLYKSWGISGIKFGFVQVGSHRWTSWMHEAVKKCAQYGLMVDIHDEYRPTGFSRTYPNLLTQEGIHGNEEMPDANNNTVLPFTRFIAGAADYTFCYYTRKEFGRTGRFIKNTPAHQLTLPVIYYSPLQFLYWYDSPNSYQGEPELEFWKMLPTTWDDTKVISGEIGKYIAIARRNQANWFVGCITNMEARELKVPLDFLEAGKKYEATLYFDNPEVQTRTHVGILTQKVDSKTVLDLKLMASGGCALLIKPVN